MSRAFVKESDDERTAGELPERALPAHANYVTPRGLRQLQERVSELRAAHEQLRAAGEDAGAAGQKQREIERDRRYFLAQLERAEVVARVPDDGDEVHFGATVRIRDAHAGEQVFVIVGDDEADVSAGRISWASPLAKALMGLKVGDMAVWRRPAGDTEVEIVAVCYSAGDLP